VIPSHGDCKGAFAEGQRCVPAAPLAVTLERCSCLSLGGEVFALHLLCACGPKANLGFIENHVTRPC